jgi:simple sugar transport system ATP-binding protein
VDLDIEAGKIHAIAGENGAGKSTLMKMLYGVYTPTSGEILMDGQPMKEWGPAAAREKGVSMVFQDFRLIPAFTVLDNIFLSLADSGFIIHRKALKKRVIEIAEKYRLHVDPTEEVWKTDLGQRQHIEIIKVLINSGTRIMIFDEPTSVLAPHEVTSFLEMLKSFRDNGYAILLITHKINEIMTVADKITVMRQGKAVCSMLREDGFKREAIISAMIGEDARNMEFTKSKSRAESFSAMPAAKLRDIAVMDDHNRKILKNVSFDILPGEILGVAGISGNGQRELAEAVFGIRRIAEGKLLWGDSDLTKSEVKVRLDSGFRMVTENPLSDNVVGSFTVLQNMALAGIPVKIRHGDIDWQSIRGQFLSMKEIATLKVPEPDRRAGSLSGGNVQRMALARAIISYPKLLIACYPSRGLDVATVNVVHRTLLQLKEQGTAILLISEDLSELFEVADKLVVLCTHTVLGPYDPMTYDANRIGKIMLKEDSDNETIAQE